MTAERESRRASAPNPGEVTRLLDSLGSGDEAAAGAMMPAVYDELRRLARIKMRAERRDHTLQTTALVHEAYLRLLGSGPVRWKDATHFYSTAAEAMRRILVDHARRLQRHRRGGGRSRVRVSAADLGFEENLPDVVALDEALADLDAHDRRMARVVKLRFFAGLSVEETAVALSLSTRTVKREWTYARAWLFRALAEPVVEVSARRRGDGAASG